MMKLTSLAARRGLRIAVGIGAATVACALAGVPALASAVPNVGAATARADAAPAATTVPKWFKASAMSWTSATDGWVLGTKNSKLCGDRSGRENCPDSQVIGTTDGGASWHMIGTIGASIPKLGNGGNGVTEIRFGTDKIGFAFAPDLHRTFDGGRRWHGLPIPGSGKQVLSLAVTSTQVYVIVSPCGYDEGVCKGHLTVWRMPLAGTTWTQLAMPRHLHVNNVADVAVFGQTVYVIDPLFDGEGNATLFYASTDAGRSFTSRPNPCPALEIHDLVQAAPSSATKVALLCDGNAGFGKSGKAVYVSANTGRKDTFAGQVSPWGIQAQLTVSPSGNLAVNAWSIGSFIDINDTHGGTTWHQIIGSGDGGAGFNDISYVSDNVAWVVYGPASMFADYGELYRTTDAGRHWKHMHI